MPHVIAACSSCRSFTDGVSTFNLRASTVRQMIAELEGLHPGLGVHVRDRMAIAIDGEIFQDAEDQPLADDSEIVLIPRIGGG